MKLIKQKILNLIKSVSNYKFHSWNNFYYRQISSRLFPRQSWLTSKIPRTWMDKDGIIEICLFECVKNLVEVEEFLGKDMCHYENFQSDTDPHYPEWQRVFSRELKEYYELITIKLPELEAKMEKEWEIIPALRGTSSIEFLKNINNPIMTYEETYGRVDAVETEIKELKTKIMLWIVTNRECMWT